MSAWRFLLDENVDPKTATYLQKEGLHAEHARDALEQGADDEADVLPYARGHDLIVVTSDVKDFGDLPSSVHAGVILLFDDTMPPIGWRPRSSRWSTRIRIGMPSLAVRNSTAGCEQ